MRSCCACSTGHAGHNDKEVRPRLPDDLTAGLGKATMITMTMVPQELIVGGSKLVTKTHESGLRCLNVLRWMPKSIAGCLAHQHSFADLPHPSMMFKAASNHPAHLDGWR